MPSGVSLRDRRNGVRRPWEGSTMKSICALVLAVTAVSVSALESAEVMKKAKELQDENPEVRAAAIAELTPLLAELMAGVQKVSKDPDPGVKRAFQACDAQIRAKIGMMSEAAGRPSRNEVSAINACKIFCTAQDIYRRTDYNRDGVLEYAQ